jgi:hypothetical protein
MPHLTFRVENTNDDQVITVLDKKNGNAEIFKEPLNHNEVSHDIQCWQGSDGKGRVEISGSVSVAVLYDVRENGEVLRY